MAEQAPSPTRLRRRAAAGIPRGVRPPPPNNAKLSKVGGRGTCAQRGAQPAPPGPCAPRPAPRPDGLAPASMAPACWAPAGKRPCTLGRAPGGPRAGPRPDPDPARKSGGPGPKPPPAAPAAPGPRASPSAPRRRRVPASSFSEEVAIWFTAFGPPQARGISPSGARPEAAPTAGDRWVAGPGLQVCVP